MSSINKTKPAPRTHEGGVGARISYEEQLRRSVMACMLWEDKFYENGQEIADRIEELIPRINSDIVSDIAVEARQEMKLRHVPLFICSALARKGKLKADVLFNCIVRADEMTEFLAIYWRDGKCPLSNQVKKGLAMAFRKFSEYQLAKYNRDGAVKLRDVLFMTHPKPVDKTQQIVWDKLVEGNLPAPDTWEVALSAGEDKKKAWTRLIAERKLGALAFLRNLRNMASAGVDEDLIFSGLENLNTKWLLPFRFISAAQAVPQWEHKIEPIMLNAVQTTDKIPGKTIMLIDVSASMVWEKISRKSDLVALDAAAALGILAREMFEDVRLYTFSEETKQLPARRGFAIRDLVKNTYHGGTYLADSISQINKREKYDRIVVLTDEQTRGTVPNHTGKTGYIINVSTNQNGVAYGAYTHISGWSESVLKYIHEIEAAR
jgi:hypothetical protein